MSDMIPEAPEPVTADEVDITEYRQQPTCYTRSTDELLPIEAQHEQDHDSVSISTSFATEVSLIDSPGQENIDNNETIKPEPPASIRLELFGPEAAEEAKKSTSSDSQHYGQGLQAASQGSLVTIPADLLKPQSKNEHETPAPCTRLGMTEDDIELESFALPNSRTDSTDHLVPEDQESEALPVDGDDQHDTSDHGDQVQITYPKKLPVNCKPIVLRWLFQVFLVVIAGMFSFLEYEVHDLPPLHFKALQFGLEMNNRTVETALATHTGFIPATAADPSRLKSLAPLSPSHCPQVRSGSPREPRSEPGHLIFQTRKNGHQLRARYFDS